MRSRNKPNKASTVELSTSDPEKQLCYEGESLLRLLELIRREIESARNLDRALPEKVWLKQQFSVGVNDVTRVLERMQPLSSVKSSPQEQSLHGSHNMKMPSVQLQAILLASDCNPRWLSKHLPNLAHSRGVPILFVRDKKGGSLRLGELLKLKTAIAIGIKASGNVINQFVEKLLDNEIQVAVST
ncbi:unnamed protein product [Coffea canephora]|uniref:Ribosomal protein eL8/eL30/eS12/Gadd45 domain-containing protein n=2 Tax=Coffea TaxID=13442 RepID=A0A068TNG2_COFCA|nr:unnamed protein product [Coffea canephora]